jgi:hypothetical protein
VENRPEDQRLLLRYLLGELALDEASRLEASYLADEHLFEELLILEDELIDGYVQNEFSEHERKRIEKHFLRSPARRQNVIFSRALIRYSAANPLCAQPKRVNLKPLSWWRDLISFFGIRL